MTSIVPMVAHCRGDDVMKNHYYIGCIRYFVEWIDDEQVKELQDNYLRIEVIE